MAAGLVPFAIGSETSGSIVTPASFCGVTALRPTYGLVSRYGAMALSWTLDKLGPFAHTADDCGLILQEIAGKDAKDPGSAGKSFYYTPQYSRAMKELKVGYAPVDFADRAEAPARPAFAAALLLLGHVVGWINDSVIDAGLRPLRHDLKIVACQKTVEFRLHVHTSQLILDDLGE